MPKRQITLGQVYKRQPFGVRRDHVNLLHALADVMGRGVLPDMPAYAEQDGLRELAGIIESYLPPGGE